MTKNLKKLCVKIATGLTTLTQTLPTSNFIMMSSVGIRVWVSSFNHHITIFFHDDVRKLELFNKGISKLLEFLIQSFFYKILKIRKLAIIQRSDSKSKPQCNVILSELYPLKTSENQRFSDVFRGRKNGKLA